MVTEPPQKPLLAEIRIGITGHRNVSASPELLREIHAILAEIDGILEDTPYRYRVISPLAEGADRIVAKAVLEWKAGNPELSPALDVLLPFEKEDYLRDFGTQSSRDEFEGLLEKAASTVVLPAHGTREEEYEAVGHAVVDRCDLLIAVWDGKPASGQGGTSDIVNYARETGRAYVHINPAGGAPGRSGTDVLFESLHRLNILNREQTPAGTAGEIHWLSETLRNGCKKYGLPVDLVAPFEEEIIPAFARMDQLAILYQKRHLNAGTVIALLATLAVATVTVQVLFLPDHPELLWLEFLEMAGILGIVFVSRRGEWHRKWIDYRIIAEQLRAYPFLALAGMDLSEGSETNPEDWTGTVITGFWKRSLPPLGDIGVRKRAIFAFIIAEYLEDQVKFYRKATVRHEARDRIFEIVGIGLFVITMIASALHALGIGHGSAHDAGLQIPALLTVFAIVLPAFGGALTTIQVQREFHKNALRYDAIARRLTMLIRQMKASRTPDTSGNLLKEAYTLITSENQDWRITLIVRQLHPA
mgnify:CR=1 FL=1